MANITVLPSAKVPLIYGDQLTMTTEWYRFFWNLYGFTSTGVIPVSKGGTGLDTIGDHQIIIGNANNVFEPASLVGSGISITYGTGTVTFAIGASGVTPGTYGTASSVGQFTINQYGAVTFAQNVPIAIAATQITSGIIDPARISGSYTGITGVGTLTVGTWNANTIGASYGGTGQSTYTIGDMLYATGSTALSKLGIGASTYLLASSGTAPQWVAPSGVTIGTATNLAGGLANQIPYQTGPGATSFITAPTIAGTYLNWSGSAFQWSANPLGDVVGPSSATDNAIARFDTTTGKLIQNSVVTIDDAGNEAGINSISFDTTPSTVPTTPGSLYWDSADGNQTLSLVMANGDAVQQIGEETYFRIKASAPITEGQVVMFTGTVGASGGLTGAPASGLTASTASYVMGIATHTLATNDWGYVTSFGLVRQINTTGGAESWVDGQILYLDPTVAGGLTKTLPTAPAPKVQVCAVVYAAANGSVFVRPTFGGILGQYEGDVQVTTPANGDLLIRNQTAGTWVNAPLTAGSGVSISNTAGAVTISATGTGGTVTSVSGTGTVNGITLTGTVTSSGSLTLGGTLSGIGNSQLTNSTISGVALGGSLYNLTAGTGVSFSTGTTYNGSAAITINATGTGGTVTSVAALTLGTTGTDLSSTVANSTTTPVITLNVPTASATNRGALSSTDWSTFNSKVTSVSGTAPVVSSGGTTPAISMAKATGSVDGYLSSTDWTTFNSKQPAGTYVTSISIASSNGFTGTSSGGATPSLTLATSVTGILKGNGTAISAATSGTDYAPATSGTSILYGNGAGGFSNVTVGTGLTFIGGTLASTASGGTVTSVAATVPAFLSISGSPITTSGTLAISYSGTALPVANGGTGQTSFTTGYVHFGSFSTNANFFWDNTNERLGIGTSSPGYKLTVSRDGGGGDGAQIARFTDTNTSNGVGPLSLTIGTANHFASNPNMVLAGVNGIALAVGDGSDLAGQRKLSIDSAGNVGIATVTSYGTNTLSVLSIGSGGCAFFKGSNAPSYDAVTIQGTGSGTNYMMAFRTGSSGTGTQVGGISSTSSATTYSTSSDYRLKEEVAPMANALEIVSKLKPVTYKWKVDGTKGQGFIAHELQEVVPECVVGEKDAMETVNDVDEDGKILGVKQVPRYQAIDTSFLVATLTAAIQELKAEIDLLKANK